MFVLIIVKLHSFETENFTAVQVVFIIPYDKNAFLFSGDIEVNRDKVPFSMSNEIPQEEKSGDMNHNRLNLTSVRKRETKRHFVLSA